jgi:hypothetical protein
VRLRTKTIRIDDGIDEFLTQLAASKKMSESSLYRSILADFVSHYTGEETLAEAWRRIKLLEVSVNNLTVMVNRLEGALLRKELVEKNES